MGPWRIEAGGIFCGRQSLAIKELAGHTSLTTTMRYMHLSPSVAIELLNEKVRANVGETERESPRTP